MGPKQMGFKASDLWNCQIEIWLNSTYEELLMPRVAVNNLAKAWHLRISIPYRAFWIWLLPRLDSVMNILRHVWGRLATPGRFYSRWKTLKNENRAPVNQLLWTWKFGSRAPMLWVNTWCSPILHSLFHCHRPAHAHLDTCKINDL